MTRRMGTVTQKPNGRWMARVECGTKEDGRRRTMSKTFDSRADAERWCVTQSVEMGRRPDLSAGVTLSALWELYEDDKGKRLMRKTMQTYTSLMRLHWLPSLGDRDISGIMPPDIQRIINALGYDTALHAKRVLSSVFTYAVSTGLLAKNPMHGHEFEMPRKMDAQEDFEDDPFGAIEERREVWNAATALRCMELIKGLPLEVAWLCCVGGGLRVEEALALRKIDVRRETVGDHDVTKLAVHAARTPMDGTKSTKTRQSTRIAPVLEPFGERLWELVSAMEDTKALICPMSAGNQNRAWRSYFEPPVESKHLGEGVTCYKGRLHELPYIPLAKMRNTHVTLLQEAGVSDSINALTHGHSEVVEVRNYMRPDVTEATIAASQHLRLVV